MQICSFLLIALAVANGHDIRYYTSEKFIPHRHDFFSKIDDLKSKAAAKKTPEHEKNAEYWNSLALEELVKRLDEKPNLNKAKNIIFFLGDGMSMSTVTAARMVQGQRNGKTGEEELLSFEHFPYTGFSKTYCANAQVPDSACTSTAYLCGVKTNIIALGVSAKVEFNNCTMSMDPENHASSIADWAQRAGKSTGFVTTTSLTHASPAGLYAKVANRFWECDADIAGWGDHNDPATCLDNARQLITKTPGRNLNVMMGGGMGKLTPNTKRDAHNKTGERQDGLDLIALWQKMNPKGKLVTNRRDLLSLNYENTDKIMGVFGSGVMNFHSQTDHEKEPTFSEMVEAAVKLLSKNENGFFLFAEAGLIDYGNHLNQPGISTDEVLEMAKAVTLVLKQTNPDETLIVVTADHGHPLTIAGYPARGAPILGVNQDDGDIDGVHYATLNYAIGIEQYRDEHGQRIDLKGKIDDLSATYPSQIPGRVGVHSGEDVVIYATGPQAHTFSGVLQQHTIPHLMASAACIGDGHTLCDGQN